MSAIFSFVATIFGYLLHYIYLVVNNYGLAIIIFTIITKIIMIPSLIKQQKSLEKNKIMQPLLQDLQERYKNDSIKFNEEYQKLIKKYDFKPFSGCLTSLIQIPILIGMLFVVGQPLTYMEKWDAVKIDTEIQEIMIEDEKLAENKEITLEEYKKANRYIELKIIKKEGILDLDFLGINLGDVASENNTDYKLIILPILSAISTYFSLQISTKGQQESKEKKKENADEIPMPNMKVMNMMMPVMSGYIAYVVPQGLGLYWFIGSLLQVGIQLLIKELMKKDVKLLK